MSFGRRERRGRMPTYLRARKEPEDPSDRLRSRRLRDSLPLSTGHRALFASHPETRHRRPRHRAAVDSWYPTPSRDHLDNRSETAACLVDSGEDCCLPRHRVNRRLSRRFVAKAQVRTGRPMTRNLLCRGVSNETRRVSHRLVTGPVAPRQRPWRWSPRSARRAARPPTRRGRVAHARRRPPRTRRSGTGSRP